jgi:protoheme IX farnesyltransferase
MTKSLQTGLLLLTGLAGYMSARCPVLTWQTLGALTGSLYLAISGSTILNMVLDRDIDAVMPRTCNRPLPNGRVSVREAAILGIMMSIAGVGWAYLLSPLLGFIVLAGVIFDVIVYTLCLKRRTAWAIIWGGIAGGMPVLAGRALGLGQLDWVGVVLSLSILLWIPTHTLTFSLRYQRDYANAGVPTFPSAYGERATHRIIAVSSVLASISIAVALYGVGMTWGYLRLLGVLSAGLLLLALASFSKPSWKLNFGLFKYASIFMLSAMVILAIGVL